MDLLRSYLDRYISLSDEQFELLCSQVKVMELSKGDYFLREGNVCRNIGFVIEGVVRTLHFDREGEVTRYFIPKGTIAVLADSFRFQAPATENLQAVTDTRLWVLRYEDTIRLFAKIPALGRLVQKMTDESVRQRSLTRIIANQEPMDRVLSFHKEYPGLLETLPVNVLTSFLKLSPNELKKTSERVKDITQSALV
jgi:CRP-like cAMP-binding protein